MTPTPTRNAALPFRRGGFGCLAEALDYAARGETGVSFFNARGRLTAALPWREAQAGAHVFARRLIGAGFAVGDRLLITAETWPGFVTAFFGAQYAGLLPVPVSLPAGLGARDAYIEQLRRQLEASGAVAALSVDSMAGYLATAAEGSSVRLAGPMAAFEALPEKAVDLRPLTAGERCYLQFSSGSTRFPLGVDIRQDQLMANIDAALSSQGSDIRPDDHAVSWLPWYHDMGLIGFLLAAVCSQRSADVMPAGEFARRPLQWLALAAQRGASITYSPSFGYDLAARRAQTQSPAGLDLSRLRLAGIGADMIQAPVLRRFSETFAPAGFDPRAFVPCYGMAEVCVGLTFSPLDRGFLTDTVDRAALVERNVAEPASGANTRELVVCGRPLPGHTVEIRDEHGKPLGERRVGRIFARGPSVMPGYFGAPEASAEVLKDGWLDTGDLGYWREGEIVVTGRAKDLIIVNGRNIWPQDIEWAVEAIAPLRRGDACAFSVQGDDGAEQVVVVVQSWPMEADARSALSAAIAQKVKETVGVDGTVRLIRPSIGLPMTSSGKLSRSRARTQWLAGAYEDGGRKPAS
ncbi:fatty acyl-AMP ligase [Vineibacter terrae]|uniref:fatty acyl-AMP ligase n=1 Tax=Vineibacter terrae TaxID=2586908 RepID=UPI002E3509B9|nr:fatty acyl-AMP ligase [Vineibacter terrae]HEX2885834.1 fatty acyl-AMP ligase [Vineibacter terrae]